MINVLIADDSPTCLLYMRELLSRDHSLRIVGQAKNGAEAVRMTAELQPSVIVMDLFMPELDGFEATQQIMENSPTPIVLVSSSKKVTDIDMSMKALKAGALTIVGKPVAQNPETFDQTAREFAQTVKSMADVKVIKQYRRLDSAAITGQHPIDRSVPLQTPASQPRVVAVVASTGGPPALATMLSALPSDFKLPILVVQHISEGFISGFVNWLAQSCSLNIKIAAHDEVLCAGTVYFAPDGYHLGVTSGGTVNLSAHHKVDGFRPSGTYLFRSAASAYGKSTIAVVLTGMGSDGVPGLADIKKMGGTVIAQDEKSCVVFGMPAAAIASGYVDKIMNIKQIGQEIKGLCS